MHKSKAKCFQGINNLYATQLYNILLDQAMSTLAQKRVRDYWKPLAGLHEATLWTW